MRLTSLFALCFACAVHGLSDNIRVRGDIRSNRIIKEFAEKRAEKMNGMKESVLTACQDPECTQDVYQIVTSKGYPCETHVVTTSDNIKITIFRIPHGVTNTTGPRPVVFLQHGLLASAADWVINFPSQSFAFLLADAGFDVWLGNVRGNTYGIASLPTDAKQAAAFWQFSFDEMAKFDLPAMVEFALATSGASQLAAYVGHSQGTAIGFIQFSLQPDWAKQKIGTFYALAPIAYMKSSTSPLTYIAQFAENKYFVHILQALFGSNDFLPTTQFEQTLCNFAPQALCGNILSLIAGFDTQNVNVSRIPVYSSKVPAGTSSQNIIHFGQLMKTGQFQAFDYFDGNQAHYQQKTPPVYYVNQMTVPTALYWGGKDIFADPTDVQLLERDIIHTVLSKEIADMDHLDFVWGLNAAPEVYLPIITQLQNKLGMI